MLSMEFTRVVKLLWSINMIICASATLMWDGVYDMDLVFHSFPG